MKHMQKTTKFVTNQSVNAIAMKLIKRYLLAFKLLAKPKN